MAIDRFLVANLLRIGGLDEFAPFRQWVQEQRDRWRNTLETHTNVDTLRQAQGRAQAYKEILDLLDQAPSLAKKCQE